MGIIDVLGFVGIAVYIVISLIMAHRIKNFRDAGDDKSHDEAVVVLIKMSGLFLVLTVLWAMVIGLTMKCTPFQRLACNVVVIQKTDAEYALLPVVGESTYALSSDNKALFLLKNKVIESNDFEIVYDTNAPYVEKSSVKEKYYLKNSKGIKILLTADWGNRTEHYTIHLKDESDIQKLNTY